MMLGLSKNNRTIVLIVTTILLIPIIIITPYLILFTKKMIILKIGCILLSGGALSNALERYIYKYVIDYISFPTFFIKKVRRIIFNMADLFIFISFNIYVIIIFLINYI
jgi:lipoprotein signal peptidase